MRLNSRRFLGIIIMRSQQFSSRFAWMPWVLAIAVFWLSSNLVLDFLVMPVMYVSGMTAQPDFAAAGYSLFWSFNRIELLCAAVILTGIFALHHRPGEFEVAQGGSRSRWALVIGLGLIGLTLIDTYLLAPEMSAMAISLDGVVNSTAIAPTMGWMHAAYWLLEVFKVACLAGFAGLCFSDLRDPAIATADALA
jgi:hypothetical protein